MRRFYSGIDSSGERFTIDVTSSISYSLPPNNGLIDSVTAYAESLTTVRILDFGAGNFRHTLALLRKGFGVTAVEFPQVFNRPAAKKNLKKAMSFREFDFISPVDFYRSPVETYEIALLTYVLQVIPIKKERRIILDQISDKLRGPRRLYWASRYAGIADDSTHEYRDGWIRNIDRNLQTFYTQWTKAETDALFMKAGFVRSGNYSGASQPYIYERKGNVRIVEPNKE